MRLTILASGSGGNATLVSAGETHVLIDAGIAPRMVEARMKATLGGVVDVRAIVTTHAHGDHIGKLDACALHFAAPVYLTEATARAVRVAEGVRARIYGRKAHFQVGELGVHPFPVPHDAPQVALVFEHRYARAGLVTDLGHVPQGLRDHLRGCQLVMLESNHDPEMLRAGPYPEFLKARIASKHGHLSNTQAAGLLRELGDETSDVVLAHLSQKCNTPELALRHARQAIGDREVKLRVADQDQPLEVSVRWTASVRATRKTLQLALPL